jgi:hypothetical protein
LGGCLDWGVDGGGWDGEGSARWDGEGDAGWDGEGKDWGAGRPSQEATGGDNIGHGHEHGRDLAAAISDCRGHKTRVHSSSGADDWWRGSRRGTGCIRRGWSRRGSVGLVEDRRRGAGDGEWRRRSRLSFQRRAWGSWQRGASGDGAGRELLIQFGKMATEVAT